MTEDLFVRVPAMAAAGDRPARSERTLASLGTYTALSTDVDSTHKRWIECQLSYTTMNNFAPWLAMDGMVGVQNMRLAGRKCRLFARGAIPDWLQVRIERDHPQFLDEPGTWR